MQQSYTLSWNICFWTNPVVKPKINYLGHIQSKKLQWADDNILSSWPEIDFKHNIWAPQIVLIWEAKLGFWSLY